MPIFQPWIIGINVPKLQIGIQSSRQPVHRRHLRDDTDTPISQLHAAPGLYISWHTALNVNSFSNPVCMNLIKLICPLHVLQFQPRWLKAINSLPKRHFRKSSFSLTQHTPIPCKCKLSTPSCFAKAFTFKWCLKAAGNSECCFTANTSIVPACTCLSYIHTHNTMKATKLWTKQAYQVTANSQTKQGAGDLCTSSLQDQTVDPSYIINKKQTIHFHLYWQVVGSYSVVRGPLMASSTKPPPIIN